MDSKAGTLPILERLLLPFIGTYTRFRTWRNARAAARARKRIERLMDTHPETFFEVSHKMIEQRVVELTFVGIMHFLDREGFVHCKVCPNRNGMKKIDDVYYCAAHYTAELKRKAATAPAPAAAGAH